MLSHLSYCIAVWGNSNYTQLDKLYKLQKKALRICLGCHYLSHSAPLFSKLKTLTVFDLYLYSIAMLGFYYFHNKLPQNIMRMFTLNNDVHNYNTRGRDSFHFWPAKSSIYLKSVRNNFPVIWNAIPPQVSSCKSLTSFKRNLKHYFVSEYQ